MVKMNFLVDYKVYNPQGVVVKSGTIRCKNRYNEFDAKVNLEKHLQSKVPDFGSLVITKCVLDVDPQAAEKFFDLFKDKKNGKGWFDQFLKKDPFNGL